VRFALGAVEAGLFPGVMLYLTYWFPKRYRARYVSMFAIGIPLASVVGAPVSGLLLGLNGVLGLKGWQWLFLVEGIPSVVFGFVVLRALPDKPQDAKWLTDDEKKRACLIAKAAEADFVKTSTGFGPSGATVQDVALMRKTVGPEMGVKASGGVRTREDADKMIRAGATRIGASASVKIVQSAAGEAASGY